MCTNPIKIIVNNEEIKVKCGKCITCRREKAQDWAIKLINEAKYHKKASFITLTFDNKILLDKNSKAYKYGAKVGFAYDLEKSKEYFKKFMKRLRKKFKDKNITFFHVGEYGEKTHRPHHHAIIFGENFEKDRTEMDKSKTGHTQYYSEILTQLWAAGRCSVQDINSNNIIYIAQYSLKKFKKTDKYKGYLTFSNRSKMNCKWVRRNHKEIIKGYINDADGKKYRIPESYKKNLKNEKKGPLYESYCKYEENINERLDNISDSDLIKKQKIKEKILEQRALNLGHKRDF